MTFPNPAPEIALDRQCEQRSEPGHMAAVLATETRRVMFFHRGQALIAGSELAYFSPEELPQAPQGLVAVYLGKSLAGYQLLAGTDILLWIIPNDVDDLTWVPAGHEFAGYRDTAQSLSAADAQIFIMAQAIANWHVTHPRCPRCGGSTEVMWSGWMRKCEHDGSEHFPRTDPAVIVAIVGADERILLANNFAWEENRYSTVAGFVEAGESAEQGAVREIAEEVGVNLHSLKYVSSQAWPFPRSLMLGYLGYTDDIDATPDNVEVRAARWFSREELQTAVLKGEAQISHRLSIARDLIEEWYGGRILEPGENV